MDNLNRVSVVGLIGMMNEDDLRGEVAIALREIARHHGWAMICLRYWATNEPLTKW